jgi:hypothetical protein
VSADTPRPQEAEGSSAPPTTAVVPQLQGSDSQNVGPPGEDLTTALPQKASREVGLESIDGEADARPVGGPPPPKKGGGLDPPPEVVRPEAKPTGSALLPLAPGPIPTVSMPHGPIP